MGDPPAPDGRRLRALADLRAADGSPNRACDTPAVRRDLGDGYELDDEPDRIDLGAVHAYISGESYWAKGRPLETQAEMNRVAARLVGLYHGGEQVGFTRTALVGGMEIAYLFDVYVLEEHRGRGLGEELVRETVNRGPFTGHRWLLDTTDAHGLYARLGFQAPSERLMERRPSRN